MSKIIQVFLNADLRCGHDGLAKLANDNNINVANLEPGQFIIFINTEMNRLKLYAANQVIAYLRLKEGKIDIRAIQLIPRAFLASGRIDYDKAIKEIIESKLTWK
jgi:hypothetical protein